MIKILIVDDHCLVRSMLKRLLTDIPGMAVVGEAQNGKEALTAVQALSPQVVLMDLNMPAMNGLEATRQLHRKESEVKVLVLTASEDDRLPALLLEAGASGYLTKNAGLTEIVRAIRVVHVGQRYISPDLAQALIHKQLKGIGTSPFEDLSKREQQIASFVNQGKKVRDISKQLNLSPKTVNSYRYRVFRKLGIDSDVQLAHLLAQHPCTLAAPLPLLQ